MVEFAYYFDHKAPSKVVGHGAGGVAGFEILYQERCRQTNSTVLDCMQYSSESKLEAKWD